MKNLPAELRALLVMILAKAKSPYLEIAKKGDILGLPLGARNEIREYIGSELAENGFEENFEPNILGIALERLIDILGP